MTQRTTCTRLARREKSLLFAVSEHPDRPLAFQAAWADTVGWLWARDTMRWFEDTGLAVRGEHGWKLTPAGLKRVERDRARGWSIRRGGWWRPPPADAGAGDPW